MVRAAPAPPATRERSPSFEGEEVLEAMIGLMGYMRARLTSAAADVQMPPPYFNALRLIDGATSMKDLGCRLRVDPSFVTAIADGLEERGLARREVDPDDRRIKNLVLTRRGKTLRARLDRLVFAEMPWVKALDGPRRAVFLGLLNEMIAHEEKSMGNPTTALCASHPEQLIGAQRIG